MNECPNGGKHVISWVLWQAFHDNPSNVCCKCGNVVKGSE